uniref:Uncharacterized protein n=1 Tax=viral metagenome TaxID=1070528 RepID=A0A6C0BFX3_9ZZZZ
MYIITPYYIKYSIFSVKHPNNKIKYNING